MKSEIAILGAGSWGTGLSIVLSNNGHKVKIWGNQKDAIDEINTLHTNESYLPGIKIPADVRAYDSLEKTLEGVSIVVLVIPTKAVRSVCQQLNKRLIKKVTIIHAVKGIEPGTSCRISEMIAAEIDNDKFLGPVVLSGPSHAEEVALKQPTTVTVASESLELSKSVQDLFMNKSFRVYTSDDLVGVELGGSLKNIIALGAGISDGLGYGDNAKAALMTRGLAEINRLGVAMGAKPETFSGLSGMGDLIVTCTSKHSRNWNAGFQLGQGKKINQILSESKMAIEGVVTTKAVYKLAMEKEIDMPITNSIYKLLFEEVNPKEEVDKLMERQGKTEYFDRKN